MSKGYFKVLSFGRLGDSRICRSAAASWASFYAGAAERFGAQAGQARAEGSAVCAEFETRGAAIAADISDWPKSGKKASIQA